MAKIIWTDGKSTMNILNGNIGETKIFAIFYDGFLSSSETKKYKLKCDLSGIKIKDGHQHFKTVEIAKQKAEEILEYWLKKSNLVQR